MTKAMDLALKLKALADQGIGGEKTTAQQLLAKHCKKHNIDIADLEEDVVERFQFKLNYHYRKLFQQIASTEIGHKVRCSTIHGASKDYCIYCTKSQWIIIKAKLDFYIAEFKKEEEIFFLAFITRNELWPKPGDDSKPIPLDEMSKEEQKRRWRAEQMAAGIKRSHFASQIDKQ